MMLSWREVHDLSELTTTSRTAIEDELTIGTPMRMIPVIHLDGDGRRTTDMMRWGFADRRAKTPLERPKHMHARAETIDLLPTFADAFAFNRGIILTKTFNVGQEMPDGKVVQHTIMPRDGKPIPLGVIWERWTDRNEGNLLTFVMLTTEANPLVATVTDRMPAIIPAEHWALWLGESKAALSDVKALLAPYEGDWEMAEQVKSPKLSKTRKPEPQPGLF